MGTNYRDGSAHPLIADAAGKHNAQNHNRNYQNRGQVGLLKNKKSRNRKKQGRDENRTHPVDLFLVFRKIPGKGDNQADLHKFRRLKLADYRHFNPPPRVVYRSAPDKHCRQDCNASAVNSRSQIHNPVVVDKGQANGQRKAD